MNKIGAEAHGRCVDPRSLRVAVYARYSDEIQDETSNEDQLRECRDIAKRKGWVVLDEYIRFDSAKTGRTLVGREGLQELVALAEQKPRPFDILLFHSSSRASRNLSDLLPLIDRLTFADVQLYFVSSGLSSEDANFRDVILMHGRNDEQFLVQLAHNVKRGQRGRVLAGYIACGRQYGYDNVPIEHPTRKAQYGRPYVIGVDRVINADEAAVVTRIFTMRASGVGCLEIARTLNQEGVPSSMAKLGRIARSWTGPTVLRMLESQAYIGKHLWNRSKQVINPKTGKMNKKPRPRAEWEIIEKPEWRIIPDELWAAVQRQLKRTDMNGPRRGGLNRSRRSRSYIFSGVLRCAVCKGNFTVVSGGPAHVRYGCYRHRFRGTCAVNTVISRMALEKQLLDALARNLGDAGLTREISRRFREQLQQALDAHQTSLRRAAEQYGDLNKRRAELESRRENIYDAIERYSMSDELKGRLDKVEASLRELDELLTAPAEAPQTIVCEEEIDKFIMAHVTQIASVLSSDAERAKREVQNRVSALYFHPIDLPEGPGFRVTGDLRLFSAPEDVKVNHPFSTTLDLYKLPALPVDMVIAATNPRKLASGPRRRRRCNPNLSSADPSVNDASASIELALSSCESCEPIAVA